MSTRRDFLKTSSLGLLGFSATSQLSAIQAGFQDKYAPKNTPRFIFLRKSNGTKPEWLVPPSLKNKVKPDKAMEVDLDRHDLPDWMSPLAKHKKHMTILQNLSAKMCTMGHSTYQSPLAVCKAAERAATIRRASVDVLLGRLSPSPFGHLEFTCDKNAKGIVHGMSSTGPKKPNFAFATPSAAYKSLFILASNDKKAKLNNQLNQELHNFLLGNIKPQNQGIKGREAVKLDSYAESVDALIARGNQLASMSDQIKKYAPVLSKEMMRDDYTTIEQQKAFVDVILSCLCARLTNAVTFTIDSLATDYTGLFDGQTINLHDVGHGKDSKGVPENVVRTKLRTHHMSLVNTLVEGLQKMPEGKGTMFDNTVIMYLPENGEKHHSIGTHVPFLILSGKNVKLDIVGRYIQLPAYNEPGHKTLGNWYTTILNAYGNSVKHYGDLDPGLTIEQTGPIKQFLT